MFWFAVPVVAGLIGYGIKKVISDDDHSSPASSSTTSNYDDQKRKAEQKAQQEQEEKIKQQQKQRLVKQAYSLSREDLKIIEAEFLAQSAGFIVNNMTALKHLTSQRIRNRETSIAALEQLATKSVELKPDYDSSSFDNVRLEELQSIEFELLSRLES